MLSLISVFECNFYQMRNSLIIFLLCFIAHPALSQDKKKDSTIVTGDTTSKKTPPSRAGSKPYKEVITNKAISNKGLFTAHKIEDKYYFEIPDTLLGRDILVVNRISKAAAGMRAVFVGYAGDQIGSNVIRFEQGPNEKLFLKKVSYDEVSRDSTQPMFQAVANSNILPIVAAFDIKVKPTDSTGTVIEVTSYLSADNDVLFFSGNAKRMFQVGSLQSDKSYIQSVNSYPSNIEIKTVKTYSRGGGSGQPISVATPSDQSGFFTLELNSSLVLLPIIPARQRYYDPRVGYFARSYTDFDANPHGVKTVNMVVRWKLEPKKEEWEKYHRGELVEPEKPIIFYIDPATPAKWVPYLIQGVNDWQVAFEKAGFKNAIIGKPAPTQKEDSTWSLEDARYSAIVYKPSSIPNASGPNVHDPRSGQIIESHINWYHNVMLLLRNWYFVQAAPNDTAARKMEFDDELMGRLIRFVAAHEVGHTLGLRHNFGSSSSVPVENLRNKAWLQKNGHTPSIMDYARFNYVAQPEDKIPREGLMPHIGPYDVWAIEWGYRWFPDARTVEEEVPILNKMTTAKLKDKRYWFGTESNADDPRSQNEDLGDNAMKASTYGIKNLQRIIPHLSRWTHQPDEDYENLSAMYSEVTSQFGRYLGHVAKNIGGIYETPKTVEQEGPVYEHVPKSLQKEAMAFLKKEIFTTPSWLLNSDIFNKTGNTGISVVSMRQDAVLSRIISTNTFSKLLTMEAELGESAYKCVDMIQDLQQAVWAELTTRKTIDVYRRNLQKSYLERIRVIVKPPATSGMSIMLRIGAPAAMIDTRRSDIISVLKASLRTLRANVKAATPAITDKMSRYHLEDVAERIDEILKVDK